MKDRTRAVPGRRPEGAAQARYPLPASSSSSSGSVTRQPTNIAVVRPSPGRLTWPSPWRSGSRPGPLRRADRWLVPSLGPSARRPTPFEGGFKRQGDETEVTRRDAAGQGLAHERDRGRIRCSPWERAFEHGRLKHGVFYHYVIGPDALPGPLNDRTRHARGHLA